MNRFLIPATGAAILTIGGYIAYGQFAGGGAVEGYANVSINMPATAASTECGPTPGFDRMICLTEALKSSLTPEILAELERPYSVAEAQKWSNFPPMGYPDRVGPTLGDFTPDQRAVIKAILMEAASMTANEGYDELEQVLNADDYLLENTSDTGFASSNYHIAFLGAPGPKGLWELYFGGHHFAMTNTYLDGALIGATPSFRGVEPFVPFAENGRDNAPMVQEQAAFAAMLGALSTDQQTAATFPGGFTDIVAGPQKDSAIPANPSGLRVGDLTPEQKALVLAAIETYVRDIAASGADAIMARYTAELDDTFIGFAGTPGMASENDYVRIDGPSVWIEFSMQPGRSIEGIHPHSVWRDKTTDYGGQNG